MLQPFCVCSISQSVVQVNYLSITGNDTAKYRNYLVQHGSTEEESHAMQHTADSPAADIPFHLRLEVKVTKHSLDLSDVTCSPSWRSRSSPFSKT